MPKKKGKKNKGSNADRKSEKSFKEEVPSIQDLADPVVLNPIAKDNDNEKKKSNKNQQKLSHRSSQSLSVDAPSTSSDCQVCEELAGTTSSGKQKKKKALKESSKGQGDVSKTSEDILPVESILTYSAKKVDSNTSDKSNSVELKKESKTPRKKQIVSTSHSEKECCVSQQLEGEEEKRKPKIWSKKELEETNFPNRDFITQQSRQIVSLSTDEPSIQTHQISKSTSNVKQFHSESSVKQNTLQEHTPLHAEDFPVIGSKGLKKQVKKKGPTTQALNDQQSSSHRMEECQQLQNRAGDYVKKNDLPIGIPETTIANIVDSEGSQLTIPLRKTRCGTKGRTICIETNHLALTFQKLDYAVHYDVTITPNTPKKFLRKVMEEFRKKFYGNRYPAFDGTKNLYSSSELPFNQQISKEVTIYEGELPRQYRVDVKFANYVDLTPLQKFTSANPNGIHHMLTPQEVIQCLDIVLRSAPALTCLPVGRSYFTLPKDQLLNLGDGMEMYYGFYQSVVVGWKPFLNIDVVHKAFPTRQNVIDLILDLCNLRRETLLSPLQRNEHDKVDRFIRTLKIQYEIPNKSGSKRLYRVNGLVKSSVEARFTPENGSEITIEKYFLQQKKIVLKYPHMPCLWVGNTDRVPHILLPAEFCAVVEGQVINRKMNDKVTSAMIKQAATSTKVRKDKIMESVRRAQFNKDPCVREFGITVNEEFTKINARVLEPPALTYSGRCVINPARGAWRPDKFLSAVTLSQWTIVILDRGVQPHFVEEMIKLLHSQATHLGMSVAPPQRPFISLQPHFKKEMQELVELFSRKKSLQLLIVIVPNTGLLYSYVKQAAELAVGCLTQCIRNRTVCRVNASIITNLLQKINTKLEGINHVLDDRPDWMRRPYMIMGADVTHPSPDAKDKPSIAAVTASYDVSAFKYNICWRLQPPKVEIIEDLDNITREQLLYFYNNTKHKPERIIFFRDGVSEGQFSYVSNTEIQAIRRACTCLQPDGTYKPKITFLVVQKRHHTRFFPINPQDASRDKNLNVPVGTCVDTVITHPTALDFCLVSHASIQGVARPTKYRVLWDDANMSEDELEQLSFYFCHMFSRCTRSVSYPAPTYYAHLAAARIMAYCEIERLNMNNLPQEQHRLCIKDCIIKQRPMFFV